MGKVLGYSIRAFGTYAETNLSLIDAIGIFSTRRKFILKKLKFGNKNIF
jgi:hypothetical protein